LYLDSPNKKEAGVSLRAKKKEIEAKGAEARKAWSLDSNSGLVRIYNWWDGQTGKGRRRENLCHMFWVIVVIAPIWWLSQNLVYKKATVFGQQVARGFVLLGLLILAAIAAVFILFPNTGLQGFLIATGILYFAFGVAVFVHTASLVEEKLDHSEYPNPFFTFRIPFEGGLMVPISALAVVVVIPVVLLCTVAFGVIMGIGLTAEYINHHDLHRNFGRWLVNAHPGPLTFLRPWVVPFIAVFAGAFFWTPALVVTIVIGVLAAFVGVIAGLIALAAFLGDQVKQARENARARRRIKPAKIRKPIFAASRPARTPGKQYVRPFLRSVVDFLSLVWQFIKAKKWKVCPLIDLPSDSRAA
jgi:hypothetical protein